MHEIGIPTATMHKDDIGCARIFESVRLRDRKAISVFLEISHAANCGGVTCARSAFHTAARLAGVTLGRLILVERMHAGAAEGGILKSDSATFTRIHCNDQSAMWQRVTSADWLRWVDQGLRLDSTILLGEIDLAALLASFEGGSRLPAQPPLAEWLRETDT